ncbi:MAG: hypothetical protein VX466_02345 [Myxococcota bacterium]|nr:hypothetical protein [Myxococcota bacterium]
MPLEQREWWGIETPRFEIMTSLGRRASVQLASDLEHFIEASEAILGTSSNRPAARIRVYAHDGKSLERPFAVANQPSYFLASKAGGTLVLRAGSGFDDATESTRFDLVRHLARNSGGSRTPLWYDEGFASFLSTAHPERSKVVVGEPRRDLLALLQDQVWPSVDQVLATTSLDHRGRRDRATFRAQAWALVHFLHFGPRLRPSPRARLDAALARMASPGPGGNKTLDWFGVPAEIFDRDLRRYVGSELGTARLVVRVHEEVSLEEPRPLECASVGEALGQLAIEVERPVIAKKYFRFAATCEEGSEPGARASSGGENEGRAAAAETSS